jgi:hypothetical protein
VATTFTREFILSNNLPKEEWIYLNDKNEPI